jgi:uncharacterized membrane protein
MGRFLFTCAIGVWLGTVVSFSYVFLPAVHTTMEGETARRLLHRVFPHYYLTGVACGLVALAAVAFAPVSPSLPLAERIRLALPVAFALLCTLGAWQLLLPYMERIDAQAAPEKYARAHRVGAMLNTTVLAALILVVAAVTTR